MSIWFHIFILSLLVTIKIRYIICFSISFCISQDKKTIFISILQVQGKLQNTGNDITLTLMNDVKNQVNVTGGPLSYMFRITDVKFHFGRRQRASEHQINNKSFTAEVLETIFFKLQWYIRPTSPPLTRICVSYADYVIGVI